MTNPSATAKVSRPMTAAAVRALGFALLMLFAAVAFAGAASTLTGCASENENAGGPAAQEPAAGALTAEEGVLRVASVLDSEPYLHADYAVVTKMGAGCDSLEALAAANDELLALINDTLAEAKADGSYGALYDTWFGDAPERGTATQAAPEAVDDSTGA